MASSSRLVHWERSADLGKYCPLALLPLCHGLLGSQKWTYTPVSTVNWTCSAISLP